MERNETIVGINETRTFGSEFEITILDRAPTLECQNFQRTPHGLWDYLVQNGVRVHEPTDYHGTRHSWTGWKMERDGSIHCRQAHEVSTIEVITPILRGHEGLAEVKRVMALMNNFGVSVNRTCGNHVHHSVADLTESQLVNLYELYRRSQKAIDGILPRSRRNNMYCAPMDREYSPLKEQDDRARRAYGERIYSHGEFLANRFYGHGPALNFGNYVRRATVEFRQASGTHDYEKFEAWVLLTQAMIETVKLYSYLKGHNDISLKRLLWMGNFYTVSYDDVRRVPSEQKVRARKYILARQKKFAKEESRIAS